MKINDKKGINETFAARPDLTEVHIIDDGRHFFNEDHAKYANGSTEVKDKDGKVTGYKAKPVKYTTLKADAKELKETAQA